MRIREEKRSSKINKSKEIIKKEKDKIKEEKKRIKEEKRRIKQEKSKKINNTKIGKIFKKKEKNDGTAVAEVKPPTMKSQIFSMIYFELVGIVLCLLLFFILSGGKNYIKLYKDLSKLINVYDTIVSDYYGDLDKEELIDSAIESMLNDVGDNYTTYTNEEDTDTFLENIEGTYEGIGCTVSMDENSNIYVVEVFENSPAKKAGLKEKDIIVSIDDKDFSEKTSTEMADYVKNSTNSKIKLVILRDEKQKEITITREKVELPTVTSKVINEQGKRIGYIDISMFSTVAYEQFQKELKKLEKENIQGLIIDVRNNTGGYLSSVTDISNLFLKKGKVIYQLEGNKNTEKVKDTTEEHRTYPIAVLINAASASASEILASAIKESYDYTNFIVGTNSYGKGTVQKTKKLSDGSMIKYTVQKWLTPNGNWLDEKGVEPTEFVELNFQDTTDNQLNVAIASIVENIK